MSTSYILWSIFLGALGIAYVVYGKKQRKAVPLLGGIVLLVLPYFSSNNLVFVGVLITIIVVSYHLKY